MGVRHRLAVALAAVSLFFAGYATAGPLQMHRSAAAAGCAGDPVCLAAPANGQVLIPGLVASMAESGQTIQPVDWKVPGQDYAIGPTIPQASGGDPLAAGNYPAGSCDISTVGTPGVDDYSVVNCNFAGFNFTFHDLDLSRRFGHGPVFYAFHNTLTSGFVGFRNIWGEVDPTNCNNPGAFISFDTGAATGPGIDIESSDFNGHDDVCKYVHPIGALNLTSTSPKTLKYTYIHGATGRVLNITGGNPTADVVAGVVINGFNTTCSSHGEVGLLAPEGSDLLNENWHHILINYSAESAACGTSALFLSAGGGQDYGTLSFDSMLILTNRVKGSTGGTGTLTATTDTDPGTGLPNRISVSAISGGTLAPGSKITIPGLNAIILAKLTGTGGAGSTFTFYCFADPGSCSGGTSTHANGLDYPSGAATYSGSGNFSNYVTAVACGHTGGNYQTIKFTNVRCDLTGSQFGEAWVTGTGAPTYNDHCVVPATFTNDFDAVTLAPLNGWSVNNPPNNC